MALATPDGSALACTLKVYGYSILGWSTTAATLSSLTKARKTVPGVNPSTTLNESISLSLKLADSGNILSKGFEGQAGTGVGVVMVTVADRDWLSSMVKVATVKVVVVAVAVEADLLSVI